MASIPLDLKSPCYRPFLLACSLELCLLLECGGEALDVLFEIALVAEELDVGAVDLDLTLLALGDVVLAA